VRAPGPEAAGASVGTESGALLEAAGLVDPERVAIRRDSDVEKATGAFSMTVAGPHVFRQAIRTTKDAPLAAAWSGPFDRDPGAGERTMRLAWLRVETGAPAGSHVVVSRVWRRNEAVPSREGVAWARVGKDGVAHVPRVAGEAGSTLRAWILPPDGPASFRDVSVDALATARLHAAIRRAGITLAFQPATGRAPTMDSWTLAEGSTDAEGLRDSAQERVERWLAAEGIAGGAVELLLRPEPDVPWEDVLRWVLRANRLGVTRLAFAPPGRLPRVPDEPLVGPLLDGDLLRQALPADRGLDAPPESPALRVSLRPPTEGRTTRIRVDDREVDERDLATAVHDAIESAGLQRGDVVRAEVHLPPVPGLPVPYEDVWRVLRVLRAAGVEDLRFGAHAGLLPRSK
jgi:hypothetical protein